MTPRPLVGATVVALVAAVLVAGCGAEQPAQAPDARPAPGEYTGRTSQRLPVSATVAEDRSTLTLDLRWRCESPGNPAGAGVRAVRHRSVTIARDGTFSGTRNSITPAREGVREAGVLRGRATAAGTLAGTWSGEFADLSHDTGFSCTSGEVTFDVRRRTSTPGVDPSGNPVVALDGPREVATGAGHVWVLEQGRAGPAVLRVDPASGAPRARTPIGGAGSVVAPPGTAFPPVLAAGEGAAWVVTGILGPRLEVTRVGAQGAGVRRIAVNAPAAGPGKPAFQSFAVGAGAAWMLVGDQVLRLDPRSGRLVRVIDLVPGGAGDCRARGADRPPSPQAERLAVGAGAVWVASRCGRRASRFGSLSRIDPRTNRVTRAVPLHRSYSAIAVGPAGVWAATATSGVLAPRRAEPVLHRIDPRDGRSITTSALPAGDVTGLGVGRRAVWVARADTSGGAPVGALHRVNASNGRASTALRLEVPSGLAIGEGGIWVVDAFARTLRHVQP